jgi:signal transduction histidine kinase
MSAASRALPLLFTTLTHPFEWLTRPPIAITEIHRRLQMRLLLGLNAVFLFAMWVMTWYFAAVDRAEADLFWVIVGPFVFFGILSGVALALGRSQLYQAAAYLTILMVILFAWVAIFITTEAHALFYILITLGGVCAAGLFLSFRSTVLVALLNIVSLVILLPPLRDPVTRWVLGPLYADELVPYSGGTFFVALVILIALSAALVIFMWMRVVLENERTKERDRAAEQTRMADEMRIVVHIRSQFLSNVSHELRTPLNAILGYSRSMQTMPQLYGGQTLPDVFHKDLQVIEESGEHLLGLINDLLDLSKLEAGKFEMDFSAVNLNEVCKGTIATAVGLVGDKPIEVRFEIPPALPLVWADTRRVRQILLNLLSNGLKFTQSGSVTLTVQQQGERLLLSVKDTGPGIPPEAMSDLFDRFKQVNVRDRLLGTGLGLDISQQLARQHGSAIQVESTLGQGSTFSFNLPIATPEQCKGIQSETGFKLEVVRFAPAENVLELQQLILIVEDDSATRLLLRRLLEAAGYVVMETHNGQEAIDAATALLPDLMLLDMHLPDMSGWQVIEALQADALAAQVPFMIVTTDPDHERSDRIGALACIEKPIDAAQLLVQIGQFLASDE